MRILRRCNPLYAITRADNGKCWVLITHGEHPAAAAFKAVLHVLLLGMLLYQLCLGGLAQLVYSFNKYALAHTETLQLLQ
jgi:hypothetical protein